MIELPEAWRRIPLVKVLDAVACATTWTEVDAMLAYDILVDSWWAKIPTVGGPMLFSKWAQTPHDERCRMFAKHGPGGRFEWSADWNRGAE